LPASGPVEYHCQLLDKYGQVVWRSNFLASSENEAIATARTFLRDRIDSTCVFELWQGRRYICCENDAIVLELGATDTAKHLSPDTL
jgi:hypothetical protein